MINQSTVFIAQPIVDDMLKSDLSLAAKTSKIVGGMNEVSYGAIPYQPETLPLTLPEVTRSNVQHSEQKELISSKLAEVIQMSFRQISHYLKPTMLSLTEKVMAAVDYDLNVSEIIYRNLDIQYRKLDLAFFGSIFYPETISNPTINYLSVPYDALRFPGKLEKSNDSDMYDLLKVNNADVMSVIDEYSPDLAFNRMVVGNGWGEVFKAGVNGGINFTDLADTCPCKVFSLYLLFSRLSGLDDPIPQAISVSLEDYRRWVNFICNCLEAALVNIRRNFKVLAGKNFQFLSSNVAVRKDIIAGCDVLKGSVTVGVTASAINDFKEAAGDTTLSEAILGKLIARYIEKQDGADDLVADKVKLGGINDVYVNQLKIALGTSVKEKVIGAVAATLSDFRNKFPEFQDNINKLNNEYEYRKLIVALQPEIFTFVNQFVDSCVKNNVGIQQFISGSNLIPALGKVVGLGLAAEVLSEATVKNTDNISEARQRELLAEAVAKVLVRFIINN